MLLHLKMHFTFLFYSLSQSESDLDLLLVHKNELRGKQFEQFATSQLAATSQQAGGAD